MKLVNLPGLFADELGDLDKLVTFIKQRHDRPRQDWQFGDEQFHVDLPIQVLLAAALDILDQARFKPIVPADSPGGLQAEVVDDAPDPAAKVLFGDLRLDVQMGRFPGLLDEQEQDGLLQVVAAVARHGPPLDRLPGALVQKILEPTIGKKELTHLVAAHARPFPVEQAQKRVQQAFPLRVLARRYRRTIYHGYCLSCRYPAAHRDVRCRDLGHPLSNAMALPIDMASRAAHTT